MDRPKRLTNYGNFYKHEELWTIHEHKWSREAGENLVDIEEFIARHSLDRAIRFVDALIDHAEAILSDNPRSWRTVPEIGSPDYRELIYRGYRIVYRLNDNRIEILTVFEGHRLLRLNAD